MEAYKFKLDVFEGPLELLMHLIEKNKVDIFDIPVAEITGQYMAYLDKMKEFNMEIASEFLVMAATLLQIKSRLMLPKTETGAQEEEDPRTPLVEMILEYSRYKQVSQVLKEMAVSQEKYYAREPLDLPARHTPPESLDLEELVAAFLSVVEIKEELKIPEVIVTPEEYNIQDKMADILSLLSRASGKLLFSEAFLTGTRSELIVTFLALLELIKLKAVAVKQQRLFGEIYITVGEGALTGGPGLA